MKLTILGQIAIWFIGMTIIVANYSGLLLLNNPWWSLITFILIVAPVIISIYRREVTSRTLFWIVILSLSLRSIVPLSEGGSCFVIDSDAVYQFQVTQIYTQYKAWIWGFETERASNYVFFPILHILSMQMSTVSGFQLYPLCRFLPVLISIFTIIVVFRTYALMISPPKAVYATFLFSICYKYNWFDGKYVQESLGIFFFAMVFYSIALKTSAMPKTRSTSIIFFFSILLLTMTHYFSSLLLIVALISLYIVSYMRVPRSRISLKGSRIEIRDIIITSFVFASWLGFVAVIPMRIGINYAIDYASALLNFIIEPLETHTVRPSTGIHLSVYESLIVYSGILVSVGLGIIALIEGTSKQSKIDNTIIARISSFALVAFIISVPAVIGQFFSAPTRSDIPSRFVPFIYFFWSPAFAEGVCTVYESLHRRFRRMIKQQLKFNIINACIAVLLLLTIASTWLLMPSQIRGQTKLDSQEVVTLSSWIYGHGNKETTLVGDSILIYATGALARQKSVRVGLEKVYVNGMIYYGENIKPLTDTLAAGMPLYLLINEAYVSHKYYISTYYYERKPPPSLSDQVLSSNNINNLPMLNRIYCSSVTSLYNSYRD